MRYSYPFIILLLATAACGAEGDIPPDISTSTAVSTPRLQELLDKMAQCDMNPDDKPMKLPVSGRISSTVGMRSDPINGMLRMHKGIDIAVPMGTPVKPVAPGTIIYSGRQPGYGNMVVIQHDDGMITVYAHHSRNLMKTGTRVDKDSTVALSGSTGHSTGPHLHFEAWQAGINVTEAFYPQFAGRNITASPNVSLNSRRIKTIILSDGTIVIADLTGTNGPLQ
jgi:murein DD-endopeptidase MepM/ murein hydrolase activator NlpD